MFKMVGLYNNAGQQEMLAWTQVCIFAFVKEMEENLYLVYNKWMFWKGQLRSKDPVNTWLLQEPADRRIPGMSSSQIS